MSMSKCEKMLKVIAPFGAVILLLVIWLNYPSGENEMISFESTQTINMGKAPAWEKLQDLTLAHHYVPGIIKTEITSDNTTGLDASRRVYQSAARYLNETVIEWNEGSGFLLHLYKDNGTAPFPFKYAEFRYQLEDAPDGKASIKVLLSFQMAGGRLGQWFSGLLAKEFQRRTDDVAKNLKDYYESLQP